MKTREKTKKTQERKVQTAAKVEKLEQEVMRILIILMLKAEVHLIMFLLPNSSQSEHLKNF